MMKVALLLCGVVFALVPKATGRLTVQRRCPEPPAGQDGGWQTFSTFMESNRARISKDILAKCVHLIPNKVENDQCSRTSVDLYANAKKCLEDEMAKCPTVNGNCGGVPDIKSEEITDFEIPNKIIPQSNSQETRTHLRVPLF